MKEPGPYCLRVASPVHIGCDEVYEPMSFILDENKNILTSFDPFDFLKELNPQDKKTFTEICRKGTVASILEIYRFLRNRRIPGHEVEVCAGLINHYQRTLALSPHEVTKNPQELNNFAIQRSAFSSNTNKPYIPGSAIKGALRTAYLNTLAAKKRVPTPGGKFAAQDLERTLLDGGRFATDPFRMLKISDFIPVGKVKTRVVYAVNRKKNSSASTADGLYQILEVIEPGSCFEGYISVIKPEDKAGIRNPLTIEKLFDSAENFYSKEIIRENKELTTMGMEPPRINKNNGIFILRLGRHSGAESLTIEGHRNIKITPGGWRNAKFGQKATTLWLSGNSGNAGENSGLRPFGWVVIESMSEEMSEAFKRSEEERCKDEDRAYTEKMEFINKPLEGREPEESAPETLSPIKARKVEFWERATLTWSPGNQILTAAYANKKAIVKGRELIPDCFHKRLFEKKKSVTARVEAVSVGNAFQIIKIEPE